MLLMSWAGEQARKDLMLAMGRDLAAETSGAVIKILDCGVKHRDGTATERYGIPRTQCARSKFPTEIVTVEKLKASILSGWKIAFLPALDVSSM
jgi:hypothetical protein